MEQVWNKTVLARPSRTFASFWLTFMLALTGCAGLVSGYVESGPGYVRAGEAADFNVVLDKAPNFDGGEIRVTVVGPQNSNATLSQKVKTLPGVKNYRVSIPVPLSAPGGTWNVAKVTFWTGAQEIQLPSNNQSFQVIAIPNIALPASAQLTLTVSQTQLLRREAVLLQIRLQALKSGFTQNNGSLVAGSVAEALRKKINEELLFLSATESRFRALADPQAQLDAPASVFFDDLRMSYEDAKSRLKEQSVQSNWSGLFMLASLESPQTSGDQLRYPVLAQAVFRVFEQNEVAYVTVANAGTLTFDLDVSSDPAGATISYRRRGDPYRQHPDQTNSVIRALPYAIWTVRFQKQGFRDEEREHDPFREPNHIINVQLTK